jgi:hypothetical protein
MYDIGRNRRYQVFLNFPYDKEFEQLSYSMMFGVVASNLIPICALDITSPDLPRLNNIVNSIKNCHYSIHDFSKSKGEGEHNYSRFNMPIEMGMALFHAMNTQLIEHRCCFFSSEPNDYKVFSSDLAGLDAKNHENDDSRLVGIVYEWLINNGPGLIMTNLPIAEIQEGYHIFLSKLEQVEGGNFDKSVLYREARELILQTCEELGWWTWRKDTTGRIDFPEVKIKWKK